MKKLIIVVSVLILISCNNSNKQEKVSVFSDETVLIVNYQL